MRYRVVPFRQGWEQRGFAIWDEKLSPLAVEEEVEPVFCSLDGKTPLVFDYVSLGWRWLAACERAGLDLEADGGDLVRVYAGEADRAATMVFNHGLGKGPVIRELPVPWLEELEEEQTGA